jgi:hypothetical protein
VSDFLPDGTKVKWNGSGPSQGRPGTIIRRKFCPGNKCWEYVIRLDGRFIHVDALTVRNEYDDGTFSEPYLCDVGHKGDKADDAVVIICHAVICGMPHVVMRKQSRPILGFRGESPTPWGFPAGCEEPGDTNLVTRAVAEVEEEVGVTLAGQVPQELGKPMYSSMGWITEKIYFYEMLLNQSQIELLKDGYVSQAQGETMEEGGEVRLFSLPKAMRNCKSMMAELGLRRLIERYYGDVQITSNVSLH